MKTNCILVIFLLGVAILLSCERWEPEKANSSNLTKIFKVEVQAVNHEKMQSVRFDFDFGESNGSLRDIAVLDRRTNECLWSVVGVRNDRTSIAYGEFPLGAIRNCPPSSNTVKPIFELSQIRVYVTWVAQVELASVLFEKAIDIDIAEEKIARVEVLTHIPSTTSH